MAVNWRERDQMKEKLQCLKELEHDLLQPYIKYRGASKNPRFLGGEMCDISL